MNWLMRKLRSLLLAVVALESLLAWFHALNDGVPVAVVLAFHVNRPIWCKRTT